MRLIRPLPLLVPTVVTLALAGCSGPSTSASADTASAATGSASAETTQVASTDVVGLTPAEALAANTDYSGTAAAVEGSRDEAAGVTIALDADTAEVDGSGATVDGSTVTIAAPGTYRISGTLDDGQVVVSSEADGVVRLVLDGARVTSTTGPALLVEQADLTAVVLADGSTNRLTGGGEPGAEDAVDSALFSRDDLAIGGDGELEVAGTTADGIVGKDGLVVAGGTVTVDAADDGIRGKDYLVVTGGTVAVTAAGNGLKATEDADAASGFVAVTGGDVRVTSAGDGVSATTDVVVAGGAITVEAGGGAALAEDVSAKGLKGDVGVVVGAGTLVVDAADDTLHSNGAVSITGGDLTLASGDDGVHADGNLTVGAGTVTVTTSYEGLEAATMTLAGGDTTITASDDGVNIAGGVDSSGMHGPGGGGDAYAATGDYWLRITGGTLTVDADGDGIDVGGSLDVTGGDTVVQGPTTDGNGAMDVDDGFVVSGGTLLAAGSAGMAMAPGADSPQGWLSAAVDLAEGTAVQVLGADGTEIASAVVTKQTANLLYSGPGVVSGETYAVVANGTEVASVTAGETTAGGFGQRGGPGASGGRPGRSRAGRLNGAGRATSTRPQ